MAARGARAASRAGAPDRHALETLETLENYPEVTGTSGAGIDLVAFVSFEPGQTKAFDKLLPLPLARE